MKPTPPNQFRVRAEDTIRLRVPPQYGSTDDYGNNGMFFVPCVREILRLVVSDGEGWEHVSVSLKHRCPTWDEMCFVKNLFWSEDETVIQFHPPKSEYVNHHPFCLHLWRRIGAEAELPPTYMVGPKA